MKQIASQGGEIALRPIARPSFSLKSDNSILTQTDLEISQLCRDSLKDFLKDPRHLLIEEEDPDNTKYLDASCLESKPFIWIIDPLDGTRAFSNGMPNFAISIGLLKEGKPWLGVVYFPMLGEMFHSDGEQSYFTWNAFSEREEQTTIVPMDQPITSQSVFMCSNSLLRNFEWQSADCHLMIPECSVLSLCWPAIGRGCGAFFAAFAWDFAGCWPIFESAGLRLRSYRTGKAIEQLDTGLFTTGDNLSWKLSEPYILSSERNYAILKEKIRPKFKEGC